MSNFLVLEFGSKSLKIHRRLSGGRFEKANVPWSLGHEVYREGCITAETRRRIALVIERLVKRGFRKEGMLAIATGAVRDAPDREDFISYLNDRLGVEVRVLSGREEASLLAQGFLDASDRRPALVIDIGGGSLETVYLGADRTVLRDSLPLGAIRLHHLGAEAAGGFAFEQLAGHIDGVLQEASVIQAPEIHGTGGPIKAISRALGTDRISREAVQRLEEQVRREGPPAGLSEERRPIFLPGVMVASRLLAHCRADTLAYLPIPIGRIFLERFLGQARVELTDSMNARLLRNIRLTGIYPQG